MSSIIEINNFIQKKLKEIKLNEISAVEMAEELDKAGLLKDSSHRPGLPLRNYLRAGRIEGAFQYPNNRWVIRPIEREIKLTVKQAAEELDISEQAVYKRIERGSILPVKIGERISITVSELEKIKGENTTVENSEVTEKLNKEFAAIYFEIENLVQRVKNLENTLNKLLTKNGGL